MGSRQDTAAAIGKPTCSIDVQVQCTLDRHIREVGTQMCRVERSDIPMVVDRVAAASETVVGGASNRQRNGSVGLRVHDPESSVACGAHRG